MDNEKVLLTISLLKQARRLGNQTVRDTQEVDKWHQSVDQLLSGINADDSPEDRWDDPKRAEHREMVQRLFYN